MGYAQTKITLYKKEVVWPCNCSMLHRQLIIVNLTYLHSTIMQCYVY